MAVTHFFESFMIGEAQITPDGGLAVPIMECDDDGMPTGHKYVFPMSNEAAKAFHKMLGEKLGQRVETATMEDMRKEAARNGVPKVDG